MTMPEGDGCDIALVLSGGVGLGAYQGGVYQALHDHARFRPVWLAGSSVGAVNAILIAGNKAENRVERLRQFWTSGASATPFGFSSGPLRHLQNWSNVMRTRLFGAPGHFRPRMQPWDVSGFQSFYSLRPMRAQLEKLVDFRRLNGGELRVSVVTTDIETGEMVIFDTGRNARLEIDHVLASCGYLPEFAPIEINGRRLGDGGLCSNAPVEVVLEAEDPPTLIILAELFSRDGKRPADLQTALERKSDLLFANQTYLKLEAFRRRVREKRGGAPLPRIVHLSYRPAADEVGSEKAFDYSQNTIDDRWQAGMMDYEEMNTRLAKPDLDHVISIRRKQILG
jgi:NTE family protein